MLSWNLFLESLSNSRPISNIDSYVDGISKSIEDKLFFVDKVKYDCVVDFGCADGKILNSISRIKSIPTIGYDIDLTMISKAKINNKNSLITDNWDDVLDEVKKFKSPLLNLSSVIHEVYSYSHSSDIKRFWEEKVFGGNFKFITIRDMIPSSSLSKRDQSLFEKDVKKVKSEVNSKYLESFEKKWGIIDDDYRTFVHFLLKYKFIDNWEREVNENYLPISLETLYKKIPKGWNITYQDCFILPFLKDQVKLDFGIDLDSPTHTKMIIRKGSFSSPQI